MSNKNVKSWVNQKNNVQQIHLINIFQISKGFLKIHFNSMKHLDKEAATLT